MARHVAKNIVAAGLADRCEVQLAYAIGVTDPVSVLVDTEGTGRVDDERICEIVAKCFRYRPAASSSISICGGRFTAKRRPAAILVAAKRNLPGKAPIARRN